MRKITSVKLMCLLVVLVLVNFTSAEVNADVGAPPYSGGTGTLVIISLFLMNLPLNIILYSLFTILGFKIIKGKSENISKKSSVFISQVILLGLIVTFIGALIDFYFLYEPYSRWWYLTFNPVKWLFAVLLIFISFYVLSIAILRMDFKVALVPSLLISLINPIIWYIIIVVAYDASELCLISLLVLFPMLVVSMPVLGKWHKIHVSQPKKEYTKI